MKKKRTKLNKRQIRNIVSLIIVVILLLASRFKLDIAQNGITQNVVAQNSIQQENLNNSTSNIVYTQVGSVQEKVDLENDNLNILFLYVGQADSTLIKLKDKVMLIDAGNNEDGTNISNFLKSEGISKIDYLVGTHADEDHIGGLDDIVNGLEIGKILMPKIGEDAKNYQNVVKAAKKKDLEIENPQIGDKFTLNDANCEIMSVENEGDYSDNNSSIVIQMNYGETKYLFMGDAEKEIENSRKWERVDVLKVGHHGSNTSSSEKFLEQVKPHYAVIEVGKNNSYRLPNKYAISRIEKAGATILRTDTNKTSFYIKSDGKGISESEVKVDLDGNEGK